MSAARGLPGSWFAVRVKTGLEKPVSTVLRYKGIEELLPQYKQKRRWSDRTKNVELPLFPGYLFCRVDDSFWLPILKTPGVLGLVGIGKRPMPVEPHEIEAIQQIVEAGVDARPYEYLEIEQTVRITCGPLAGLEGQLLAVQGDHRLIVSVTMLRRSVAVQIDRSWIIPVLGFGHESRNQSGASYQQRLRSA